MSAGLTEGNSTDFSTGSASALNGDVIASLDVNDYQAAYIQITGTFSATARVQGSNDNTNFKDVAVLDVSSASAPPALNITTAGLFYCPTPFRYFRIRVTSYTSGTISGLTFFQKIVSGDVGPRYTYADLRDQTGTPFGTASNPVYTSSNSEILSPLPGFVARANKVLAAGATQLDLYTMTQNIAIIDFHFGGRGIGQASLLRVSTSAVEFVPNGGFNSSGDVAAWSNAGNGSSALLTWTYSTAQFVEGTGSASLTFTQSDSNNFPAIKYTYSTPKNVTQWTYISAHVRVTVAAGGAQSRSVQVILTDVSGNTRTYSITGTTTTAPFNTEQWLQILGTLSTPNAETGTFDPYNVSSVTLKLLDGGNKTGTIYWDNVRFLQSQTLIERIYIDANRTFQLVLDPVELFNTGEVLGLEYKNNDSTLKEYTVTAKGVVR